MAKIISLAQHKGGTGKTTSAVNIGAAMSLNKKKVLVIDLDPQANMSQSLGIAEEELGIYGALREEHDLKTAIINIRENLDAVPADLDLSGAEIELSSEAGREYILKELLDPVRDEYDYILIDSPPSLGLLTVNALTASNEVLIPLQAQFLSIRGLSKLIEIIEKIKKRLNKQLKIGGVFITQYDGRKILNRNVLETIKTHFQSELFNTVIRDNVSLAEAPSAGEDIFVYAPKSNGAKDYKDLCKEILKRHEK